MILVVLFRYEMRPTAPVCFYHSLLTIQGDQPYLVSEQLANLQSRHPVR